MKTESIVTCFLESNGKILILKRSEKVSTYQNKWAGVSGYIESTLVGAIHELPLQQALQEIREETGLTEKDIELIKQGNTLESVDLDIDRKWVIHPFLFKVKTPEKIKIDWEHCEMQWISPTELCQYSTVPKLKEALETVISKIKNEVPQNHQDTKLHEKSSPESFRD